MISFALAITSFASKGRVTSEATTVRSMAAKSACDTSNPTVARLPIGLRQVGISRQVIDPTNPKPILSQFDLSAYDSLDKTGSSFIEVAEVASTADNRKASVDRQNYQPILMVNSSLSDTGTVQTKQEGKKLDHRGTLHEGAAHKSMGSHSPLQKGLPSPAAAPAFASNSSLQLGQQYNDFLLTAYAISPRDTGKQPDSPEYGITYSGTRAKPGRTVAVDPHIIPIGTMLWIEGIGIRYAEDIGGAIKGKHIDVLMRSDDDALRFGVKRHVRIYTLLRPNS